MQLSELIEKLTEHLKDEGDMMVRIAGERITDIDIVPAIERFPQYLDIVGA